MFSNVVCRDFNICHPVSLRKQPSVCDFINIQLSMWVTSGAVHITFRPAVCTEPHRGPQDSCRCARSLNEPPVSTGPWKTGRVNTEANNNTTATRNAEETRLLGQQEITADGFLPQRSSGSLLLEACWQLLPGKHLCCCILEPEELCGSLACRPRERRTRLRILAGGGRHRSRQQRDKRQRN